jgi:arylsulfatase A-like enzyme
MHRSHWLHPILLAASLGVMAGLLRAAREIVSHGYLELGFWRTCATMLRSAVLPALALGAGLGLIVALMALWGRRLWGGGELARLVGDGLVRRARRHPELLAAPAAFLPLIALLAIWQQRLSQGLVLGLAAAAAAGAIVASLELNRTTAVPSAGPARWRAQAWLYAGTAGIALWACFGFKRKLVALGSLDPKIGDLFLAGCLMVLGWWCWSASARPTGWGRWWPVLVESPLLLAIAVVLLPQAVPARWTPRQPYNVLLIGIDTLRYDHTSIAGDGASRLGLSPNLAALGARGTVFTRALSQAPWTLASFSSILTGKYPPQHGAISQLGKLRPRELTLGEIFHEAGYRTCALVTGHYMMSDSGVPQGFERVLQKRTGRDDITSDWVTDRAIDFIQHDPDRPFFVLAHYYDPHYRYQDHRDFHLADGYRGWLRDGEVRWREQRHLMRPHEIQFMRDVYAEEVQYTDRAIGRLLDRLRRSGLDRDTVILVVADHGEELLEHGWVGHLGSMHQEVLHVPMILVLPAAAQRVARVDRLVETRRVFATLLDAVGIELAQAQGASLVPLATDFEAAQPNPQDRAFSVVYSPPEQDRFLEQHPRALALVAGDWKLIHDLARDVRSLYNLSSDPGERTNLADQEPEILRRLDTELDEWWAGMLRAMPAPERHRTITNEEQQRLRSLGYL